MLRRAGVAIGLLLGIGITYGVVTSGPGDLGISVFRHRHQVLSGIPFLFSFAPTADECACDAGSPANYNGAAVYVTEARTSSAYCTKGNDTTGIGPGAMVLCPANTLRIEVGHDPTTGLGVLSELQRVNSIKGSEVLGGADWDNTLGLNGAAAPVVTNNAAASPDGGVTAERIQYAATTAAGDQASITLSNTSACPPGVDSVSLYVRGHSADQVLRLGVVKNSGGVYQIVSCVAPGDGGYNRCGFENFTVVADGTVFFGNTSHEDGLDHAAADVDVWGVQCENGSTITSYIGTAVGATATRTLDAITSPPLVVPAGSNLVVKADWSVGGVEVDGAPVEATSLAAANTDFEDVVVSGATTCNNNVAGVLDQATAPGFVLANKTNHSSCDFNGLSSLQACLNSACADAGTQNAPQNFDHIVIGAHWNGFVYQLQPNAVVKNVMVTELAQKDIYLFGDSIVEGHTAGVGHYPQNLIHAQLGNRVAINNEAVSSRTSTQCKNDLIAQLNYVVDAGTQARTYFMLQCGINTLPDTATAISDLEFSIATAQDAGVHMLWSTITPHISQAADINTVNVALKAFATSRNIRQADTFSLLQDPNTPGALNIAYDDGSGVHLNAAGTAVETAAWIFHGGWSQ